METPFTGTDTVLRCELRHPRSQGAQQLLLGNPSLGVAGSVLRSGQIAFSSKHLLRLRDSFIKGQMFEPDQGIAIGERPKRPVRRNDLDRL